MKLSLKGKVIIIFFIMEVLVGLSEVVHLRFFKLPQLYLLEAETDKKDVNRIKSAFTSSAKELEILSYDNAVWNDAFDYINDRNSKFIKTNFVQDTYNSININGIYLYDKQGVLAWGKSFNRDTHKPIKLAAFDLPSEFVERNILTIGEYNAPIKKSGYTVLNGKLVMFAATSIFKADLTKKSNGTLVFWRFVDKDILLDLQKRSGIEFEIETISDIIKKNTKKITKDTYIKGSYRDHKQLISDNYPMISKNSRIHFTYKAPERLFVSSWFNGETISKMLFLSLSLFIIFVLIHRLITKPIIKAEKTVHKIISENNKTIKFSESRKDELGKLFWLINKLLEDVHSKEQELKSHNVRLQKLSTTDGLTDIANRRSFDLYMNQLLNNNSRTGDVSLLVCDVDYFKRFNDHYGHAAGDNTLKQIAQCLLKSLHSNSDFVARYGGEEFVIVLNDTNQHQGVCVGNNLLQAITNLNITHVMSDISDVVTISIGLHTFEKSAHTKYESLFNKADKALYIAKEQGRNQLVTSCQIKDPCSSFI